MVGIIVIYIIGSHIILILQTRKPRLREISDFPKATKS